MLFLIRNAACVLNRYLIILLIFLTFYRIKYIPDCLFILSFNLILPYRFTFLLSFFFYSNVMHTLNSEILCANRSITEGNDERCSIWTLYTRNVLMKFLVVALNRCMSGLRASRHLISCASNYETFRVSDKKRKEEYNEK